MPDSKVYTKQWVDSNGIIRYFKDADARTSIATMETKLDGIETGAQVNTIEEIKVNNSTVTPDQNKVVSITIPAAPVQSVSKNGTAITPDGSGNVNVTVPIGAAADKAVDSSIEMYISYILLPVILERSAVSLGIT